MATVEREQMPLLLEEPAGDGQTFLHAAVVCAGIAASIVMMWAIDLFAPEWVAVILLDIHRSTYPFTIQTFEWLAFGFCLGELAMRVRDAAEQVSRAMGYAPR